MNPLQLPKKDAFVFVELAKLPLSDLQKLFLSLGEIEPGIYFVDRLRDAVSDFANEHSLSGDDLQRVIHSLIRTHLEENQRPEADFVKAILDAVIAGSGGVVADINALQTVIVNLLALHNIRLSMKATALALDGERPLSDVDIISDIRAVFSDSESSSIDAMFVSTLLKISYYEAGSTETKFLIFSIDDEDIEKLERVALGAKKRRDALCMAIEKSEVKLLRFNK